MKRFRTTLALVVLAAAAATGSPTQALGGVSCHAVNAKGVGQEAPAFVTTAQILGGGLLHGTTKAAFTPTGFDFPIASFVGTIEFTVNNGTLTAGLSGTLNVLTGEFTAATTDITGTGKLAGATGTLVFSGVEDLSTGAFTEIVTGEICADLSP